MNVKLALEGTRAMQVARSLLYSGLLVVLTWPVPSAGADPLPASRRTDWTYTGVPGGIPVRTTICATFAPGVATAQINTAIAACGAKGGGVVQLTAGIFTLTERLAIWVSNVTLRGRGAESNHPPRRLSSRVRGWLAKSRQTAD